MIGGPRRVKAKVKMEQAWMPVGEIPVGGSNIAQVAAPVLGGLRQLDSGQSAIGDPPQQLVLRAEMMQHGHRVDADPHSQFPHGKAGLAVARQHVERRIEDGIFVETPPSARAGLGLALRLR